MLRGPILRRWFTVGPLSETVCQREDCDYAHAHMTLFYLIIRRSSFSMQLPRFSVISAANEPRIFILDENQSFVDVIIRLDSDMSR